MARVTRVQRSLARVKAHRRKAAARKSQPPSILAVSYTASLLRIVREYHAKVCDAFATRVRKDALDASTVDARLGVLRLPLKRKVIVAAAAKQGAKVAEFSAKAAQRLIGIVPEIDEAAMIGAFVSENVALITSLPERLHDDLRSALLEMQGSRAEDIAAVLAERFAVGESQAALIAVDQTLKLNGQMVEARQTAAGIESYEWVTSKDERVREEHQELDGTTQSWGSPPIVDKKSGRRAHPGGDFRCRCTANPILESEGIE